MVPAVIFLGVGPADARTGWSVPVSTDTAFALGVLALLGRRIAPSLRVMLLAIAIIDDILAIAIIALFYSSTLELRGVVLMTVGVAMILGLQRFGVRHVAAYLAPALVVWAGCTWAGIHPARCRESACRCRWRPRCRAARRARTAIARSTLRPHRPRDTASRAAARAQPDGDASSDRRPLRERAVDARSPSAALSRMYPIDSPCADTI